MSESRIMGRRMLRIASWAVLCLLPVGGGVYYHWRTARASMPLAHSGPPESRAEDASAASLFPSDPPSQLAASDDRAGDPAPTEVTVDPVLDRLLESLETEAAKALDEDEEARLAEFELKLRQQLALGWKPPWREFDLDLTDEEIRKSPTRDLGIRLWATGLHARELIAFSRPNDAMKRLEVCYRGYAELFSRPDLWEAFRDGVVACSAQLAPAKSDQENLNFVMSLTTLPEMYAYPPIRRNMTGHEKEMIQAHITALLNIKEFVRAVSVRDTPESTAALVTPRTVIVLCQSALAIGKGLSPTQASSARDSLSQFKWSEEAMTEDIPRYVEQGVAELRGLVDR